MDQNKTDEDMLSIFGEMSTLARESQAINLSQGIPDQIFDAEWKDAVINSCESSWQYTPASGIAELNQCVYDYFRLSEENQNTTTVSSIITSGCTESLLCALHTFRELGYQRILTFEPYYAYYPVMAQMAGLSFAVSRLDFENQAQLIDWDDITEQMDDTTIILINSPHNPTGYVLSDTDWDRLVVISNRYPCAILIDDVYKDFNYVGYSTPYRRFSDKPFLVAGSLSKILAATGVRIGWLYGDKRYLNTAIKMHMCMSNCTPEILQLAACKMLIKLTPSKIASLNRHYRTKRDRLFAALQAAGFKAILPMGGHFIIARTMGNFDAKELCYWLTTEIGVCPLPLDGFFYSYDGTWMRFSFALEDELLEVACKRIMEIQGGQYDL